MSDPLSLPAPDLAQIGEDLAAVFPELGPATVARVLGAGFRSLAAEKAAEGVFRSRADGRRVSLPRLLAVN